MKFKEINDSKEIIDNIKEIYYDKDLKWDDRMDKLKTLLGKSERTVRKYLVKLGIKEKLPPITQEQIEIAKIKEHTDKKYYLVTSAQNATKINTNFWLNLNAYAEFLNAEILVIPYRYHNPNNVISDRDVRDDWWDTRLTQHLTLNRHNLNNAISILSDIKIQPTSNRPLEGVEGLSGNYSCVLGHPKIELKTVPVMDSTKPKIMFTTGACTKPNFSDSKLGKRAEFDYCVGFSIIEIKDEDNFFFRQVSAKDNGEFIDLFYHVKNGIVNRESDVDALIMGDIHVRHCDNRIIDKTFSNLISKLYPNKIFIHDIMDSSSISHHNLNDPFILHEQELKGENSLEAEIDEMIEWLKQFEKYNVYIVKSNHDEHVDKFLKTTALNKMTTLKNAIPYMEYSTLILKGVAKNGIIPYIINKSYPNFKCLTYNDNIVVNGFLCSAHGHIGVSGTRGSVQQFSKLSVKSVIGHTHTISRISGCASVGTSTHLRLNYNLGPSTWVNSHGIVNRLGKFQHIVFFHTKDGVEFTTLE